MRVSEIVRLVFLNIIQNKFKVVLTSIGIIVGAATIVLVIAVGRGGQMDVSDQFKNLNVASIEVTAEAPPRRTGGDFGNRGGTGGGNGPGGFQGGMQGGRQGGFGMPNLQTVNASLTEEDAEDIAIFVPNILYSTISANGSFNIIGGILEAEESHTVAAVKPDYATVSNLSLYIGDFFSEDDEEQKTKYCVLGYNLARDLFEDIVESYDNVITIEGTSFTVIGVLQQMGTVSSGISPDEAIYIPYSTGTKYIFGRDINPQLSVVATGPDSVAGVIGNISILLGDAHPGASFTLSDAGSKMEAALKSSQTMQILLFSVAVIVFIVGGIGIMNVMFVSVKERTSEIGILKALGMHRPHVLLEFLFESIVISMFGGAAGIGLSLIIMPFAERFGVRMEPVLAGYAIAFAFAVICGIMFGVYPAFKASKLIPVEALTQD